LRCVIAGSAHDADDVTACAVSAAATAAAAAVGDVAFLTTPQLHLTGSEKNYSFETNNRQETER